MSFYIYNDNRQLGTMDSIDESKRLMNGHKWELFCLYCSYIGWLLLSCLTLGILLLWVIPKMQLAVYIFYLNISGKINEEENNEEVINFKQSQDFNQPQTDDAFILSKGINEEDNLEEEFKELDDIIEDEEK